MAYRRKSYTYWDGDAIFPIPFEYLEQDDILVFINDEQTTDFVIENTQVKLNNIPTEVPAIIKIVSATDIDKAIVDWENVSSLDEDNLILSDNQIRYAVQELYDNTEQFKTDTNQSFEDYKQETNQNIDNFREEIHTLLDDVSEAAELISSTIEAVDTAVLTTQEQALIATEQKELATEQANIAIAQTELVASTANKALENIETLTTNSEQALETLSETSKQEIEALSNTIKTDANDIINTTRLKMGMTVVLDKVLSFEESQGLALQGTYVYKTAVAGERYGYPDFYNTYVGYKNNATATQTTLGSSTITIYNNANGLKFYNIADKGVIDTWFNSTGIADFYGIDETNERIFLPRNNKFWQFTTNTGEVNNYVEAGLPNITGVVDAFGSWAASGTGAFTVARTGGNFHKGGTEAASYKMTLNASNSNATYGKSNTVQPASSKKLLYYVVGNTVSDTSWVDVVTQVNGGVKDLEDKTQEGIERLNAIDALKTTQITNCITEIPQDIKLELKDGVLTLKAGSKVYVPNGFEADGTTPKFDEVVVESDTPYTYTWTPTSPTQCMLFLYKNGSFAKTTDIAGTISGTTQPTTAYTVWYDTQNNIMKRTGSPASTIEISGFSFPIAIITQGSDGITKSLDQTFNGFGYIGSTWWLENLEGLGANGYNANGTYKNVQHKLNGIVLQTFASTVSASNVLGVFDTLNLIGAADFKIVNSVPTGYTATWLLNKIDNRIYQWNGSSYNIKPETIIPACTFDVANGVISNFQPKQTFRAVDYSDSSTVSGWGMPSDKYIDLTLGASGSTYTAPANGFVSFKKTAGSSDKYANIYVRNSSDGTDAYAIGVSAATGGQNLLIYIPIKKGAVYVVNYNATGSTFYFRFIYAEGEV